MDGREYHKRRSELERDRAMIEDQMSFKRRYKITHNPRFDELDLIQNDRGLAELDERATQEEKDAW